VFVTLRTDGLNFQSCNLLLVKHTAGSEIVPLCPLHFINALLFLSKGVGGLKQGLKMFEEGGNVFQFKWLQEEFLPQNHENTKFH